MATFEVVPLQVGRFAVAVSHEIATLVLLIVTFAGGFAVFQAVTAAVTVARVALVCQKRVGPRQRRRLGGGVEDSFGDEDLPDIDRQSGSAHQPHGHEAEQHGGSPCLVAQEAANGPRSGGERAFHDLISSC